MTTVGIVEDNAIVRRTITDWIDQAPGHRCVCACGSAEEALVEIPRHAPDIVLMDIHLPNRSGIACTAELKRLLPRLQILMITVYKDLDSIFQSLKAGACGYLLKRSSPQQILSAIAEVRAGGAPMTGEIARKLVESLARPASPGLESENLSRREMEILEALTHGQSNKEIAKQLSLGVETIRTHLARIYQKLHVRSRTEAALRFHDLQQGTEAARFQPHRPV